jgi:hypothetical protein
LITKGETVKPGHAIYCAAAVAVALAGVIHLMLGAGSLRFNGSGMAILFTVGGLLQIFWIIPMARRWGPIWYIIGIAGNVALFAMWLITRYPDNPLNGRGFGFPTGFSIQWIEEAAQLVYIGLTSAILALERKSRRHNLSERDEKHPVKSRKGLAILGAIVAALILFSLFALPALMPRPPGGQRGPAQGGFPAPGQVNQNAPTGPAPAQRPVPP